MRLLSRREHSKLEIKQKLAQRKCPPDEIVQAIKYCVENDWLNETRFIRSLLRTSVAKGHGWQRICFDAKKKGIDLSELESIEQSEPHDWYELAKEVLCKKFGDLDGHLPVVEYKERAKWFRFLQQRGFSFDEINYAISGK